jgi:hypothetical protein
MKELKIKYYNALLDQGITEPTITSLLNEDREVIVGIISERATREQINLNKQVLKILSDKFGSKFGRFLNRRLNKNKIVKNIDLAGLLKKYNDNPSDELYEQIFVLLSDPMMDYFISRTIGFRNDLAKITPFKKAIGTGNFKIDYALYRVINQIADNDKFLESLKTNLRSFIDGKLDELYRDTEYKQLLGEGQMLEEGIITDLWRKWTSSERRNRIKLLSKIYKILPKIKKRIKRKVRDDIFKRRYSEILRLKGRGLNAEVVAKTVANPIVDNFISQMAGSKVLEQAKELEPFYVVTLKALRSKKVVRMFRDELEEIIKVQLIKKQNKENRKKK